MTILFSTEADFLGASIAVGEPDVRTAGYFTPGDGGGHIKKRISTPGTVMPWHKQSADGAWWEITERELNPRALGVVGDYATNDTSTFRAALNYAATFGVPIVLDAINIGIVGSIDLPEKIRIRGVGGANIYTWLPTADKLNVRPGYKHLVSGSNIWLKGTATKTYSTNRSDGFSSFTYGLSYLFRSPCDIRGLGIVQDMDVYNSGGTITTGSTDNRANYNVGFVVRSYASVLKDCRIFGYWGTGKASLVLHSQQSLENVDSDYFRAENCDFTSVALLGKNNGVDNGLTGSTWVNCGMYCGADHHTPADGDYTKTAILIDGDNGVRGIRGHKWLGGNLRTRSNTIIKLDHCDNVAFEFSATETPALAGVTGADQQGVVIGTANTGNVRVVAHALSSSASWGMNDLAAAITGSLIAIGGASGQEILVSSGGAGTRIKVNSVGDSVIQLTRDFTSETSDWNIIRDDDADDKLEFRYDNTIVVSITKTGAVELAGSLIKTAGELDLRAAASQNVRLRSGSATALVIPTGGVYGTTTASAANVNIASNNTLARSTSSAKYKAEIEDLSEASRDLIAKLRPVWYRSLCEGDNKDWSYYGLIAEEVAAVDPRLVHWRTTETTFDEDGEEVVTELATPVAEGVMYDRLVVHLIAKVNELEARLG